MSLPIVIKSKLHVLNLSSSGHKMERNYHLIGIQNDHQQCKKDQVVTLCPADDDHVCRNFLKHLQKKICDLNVSL